MKVANVVVHARQRVTYFLFSLHYLICCENKEHQMKVTEIQVVNARQSVDGGWSVYRGSWCCMRVTPVIGRAGRQWVPRGYSVAVRWECETVRCKCYQEGKESCEGRVTRPRVLLPPLSLSSSLSLSLSSLQQSGPHNFTSPASCTPIAALPWHLSLPITPSPQ